MSLNHSLDLLNGGLNVYFERIHDILQNDYQYYKFLVISDGRHYKYTIQMLTQRLALNIENQRFKQKLQQNCPNYAYEVLLLEIIVEDDHYARKPTIEEISKLIQLYMLAVQVLESSSDKRYDYFKRKIHSLMLKKHIVEQMHMASGKIVDEKTYEACNKADLQIRKSQHEIQVYFNKTDNNKIQQMIKKSQIQANTINSNIKTNIMMQETNLEERIKNRKLKSQSGSVSKFKMGSHNAKEQSKERVPRFDPRMQYFDDYKENPPSGSKINTMSSKSIRNQYGSVEKMTDKRKIF